MNNSKNLSASFVFGFIFLSLAACQSPANKKGEAPAASTNTVIALTGIQLQEASLLSTIRIPGELAAYQQVDLYAKVNSFVKKLHVDAGSQVQAGQLLATLEAPEINSQLSAAASRLKMQEAVYAASKATYNRLLETSKTPGTISPNDLEQAFARQQSDEASLQALKAQYNEVVNNSNYLQVRAPFSGVIATRNVSAGAYVGPSGRGSELPMFTLVEQKKLRLVVSVPEAYTGYLNNTEAVKFVLKSQPRDTFSAHIARQSGALDNRLRSERIEMDVDNSGKKLLPGMVAEVLLPLKGKDKAFVVPSSAVLNSTEGVYVIRVKDKKTTWVPVTVSRTFDGKSEIYGDLAEKDILIKNASEEVRNGGAADSVTIEEIDKK